MSTSNAGHKKSLVVLTGAGVSAESGIATFRDSGGLWEGYSVEEVATPEGFKSNPALVLDFYNQRRKNAREAKPNRGHEILAALEEQFLVTIITQNVDNLHERAGSSNVIHLHGSLFESRSAVDESLIYVTEGDINIGDKCDKGSQLRPNIVWFGEMVLLIEVAADIAAQADIFLVVGTSLVVYPAAGLISFVPKDVPKYIVDPKIPDVPAMPNLYFITEKGGEGMEIVRRLLIDDLTRGKS